MTAVVPVSVIHAAAASERSAPHGLGAAWGYFERKWHACHLSHRGSYSIERLQAFDNFCHHTSFWAVLCICVVLPLPALAIAILVECIPLQDPSEGWLANHGIWTRFVVGNSIINIGFLVQINAMVLELNLRPLQILFIAVSTAGLTCCLFIGVAVLWAFPIPFGLILMVPVYLVILVCVFVLAVGLSRLRSDPELTGQLKDQIGIIIVQGSLFVIYPAFGAVYKSMQPTAQTFFIVVLPIIKAVMGNVVAYAARNVPERIPGITLMSVEVSNALYSVKCLQNAGSNLTYLAILAWDLFEFILTFRDLRAQTTRLHGLRQQRTASGRHLTLSGHVMEYCLEPGVLDSKCTASIRARSSVKFKLTEAQELSLARIESLLQGPRQLSARFAQQRKVAPFPERTPCALGSNGCKAATEMIALTSDPLEAMPLSSDSPVHVAPPVTDAWLRSAISMEPSALSSQAKRDMIQQTLAILFQCEFHILVEYVECIIPFMYAFYMAILFHLPSVEYYPDTVGKTMPQLELIVAKILLYAVLEIVTFVILHYTIKWKCGVSPVFILAFVLETQFLEFQGRLVVWYLFILEFTLVQFGTSQLTVAMEPEMSNADHVPRRCGFHTPLCMAAAQVAACGRRALLPVKAVSHASMQEPEESRIHSIDHVHWAFGSSSARSLYGFGIFILEPPASSKHTSQK